MQQLIDRRGAVPRLVLDAAHNHTMDVRISIAIDSLKLSDITGAEPSIVQTSHRVVRIHPSRWRQGEAVAIAKLPICPSIQLVPSSQACCCFLLWSKACISGCMHAGDFGNFTLSFLSADIERRVVNHMQTLMSGNMASLMQLTRSTHRQVVPFLKTTCANSPSGHCGGHAIAAGAAMVC